jgi:hypothetical protein
MAPLLSLNLGLPRDIAWKCKTVHTAIWREPVHGRPILRWLNIDGDAATSSAGRFFGRGPPIDIKPLRAKATATRAGAVGA